MEKYGFVPQILLLVALLSAGAILFLVTRKVIEQMGIFRGHRAGITAFSISCLIVASVAMLLLVPGSAAENGYDRQRVNFSLLPGVAVAATIILLQLFVIAAATAPNETNEVPARKSAQNPAKPKSPGRPRKEEPGRPPTPQKSGGKGKSAAKVNSAAEGATTS